MKNIRQRIRKWLSMAVLVVMAVSMLPTAAFAEENRCLISYEVSPLGSAGVSGPSSVARGESLPVAVSPEDGYAVDSVTANGEACSSDDISVSGSTFNYLFPNITEDTVIQIRMRTADAAQGVSVTPRQTESDASAECITSWSYPDNQDARFAYSVGIAPASPSEINGLPASIDAVINGNESRSYAITGWSFNSDESSAVYNQETAGEYVYDAVLEEHPAFAAGVSTPQMIVAITAPVLRSAPLRAPAVGPHDSTIVTGTDGDYTTYQNKYIEPTTKIYNGNYTNTITLENWVAGDFEESKFATEMVIELDYSASMDEPTADGHRRWKALAKAMKASLDILAAENDLRPADKKIYVTIKGYNYRVYTIQSRTIIDSSNVEQVKSKLLDIDEGLDWPGDPWGAEHMGWMCEGMGYLAGGTRTDLAMGDAKNILLNSDCELKTCLLVTDGVPATQDSTIRTTHNMVNFGNTALDHARAIKDDGGVIFTTFIGATAGQIQYADEHTDLTGITNSGINYPLVFMSLLSSDNPYNGHISMTGSHYDDAIDSEWMRCTITGYTATTQSGATAVAQAGYIDNCTMFPATMKNLVQGAAEVANYIRHFSGRTGPFSTATDVITWPFEWDKDVPVRVYTQDKTADGWADELVEITDQVNIRADWFNNKIRVSGFDYEANYVSTVPKRDTGIANDYGRRLVIKFDIRLSDPNFGGNTIPTNETSSLWDADKIRITDKSEAYPVGYYPIPHTDLVINYDLIKQDQRIYFPDHADLETAVHREGALEGPYVYFASGYSPDGDNNAFVDIHYDLYTPSNVLVGTMDIPAGSTWEDASWTFPNGTDTSEPGEYTIRATVTPADTTDREMTTNQTIQMSTAVGTYSEETYEAHPWVYLFKPVVTFGDDKLLFKNKKDANGDIVPGEWNPLYLRTTLGEQSRPANMTEYHWECETDPSQISLPSDEPALYYNLSVISGASLQSVSPSDQAYLVTENDKGKVLINADVFRADSRTNITTATTFNHVCSVTDAAYHSTGACDFETTGGNAEFCVHLKKIDVEPYDKSTKQYKPILIIDKQIDVSEAAYGDSVFMYRISSVNGGNTYYAQAILSGGALTGTTGPIYLEAGTYSVTEMSGHRYGQVSVSKVAETNGGTVVSLDNSSNVPKATIKVAFSTQESARQRVEIKFENELSHYDMLSHATGVRNRLGTDADQEGGNAARLNIVTFDANGGSFNGSTTNEVIFVYKGDGYWEETEDSDRYAIPTKFSADTSQTVDRTFNYTGGIQQLVVPIPGKYQLEVWGGKGGGSIGGKGGYSKGTIDLAAGDVLYIGVGGEGVFSGGAGRNAGGYNGGGTSGAGALYYGTQYAGGGSGGGATHIALNSNRGVLANYSSNRSEILLVAGGGGGHCTFGNTGGAGGGTSGGTSGVARDSRNRASGGQANPGTQTSGYAFGKGQNAPDSTSSNIGSEGNGGGGGGWYGGYANQATGTRSNDGGGGGSGYIGGVQNGSTSAGVNNAAGKAKVTLVHAHVADTFDGWWTQPEGGERVNVSEIDPSDCDGLVLYAHWVE